MRQLVFVLIALLAVVTFIRAYDVPAQQELQGNTTVQTITTKN
jgi:hypothetical protein